MREKLLRLIGGIGRETHNNKITHKVGRHFVTLYFRSRALGLGGYSNALSPHEYSRVLIYS